MYRRRRASALDLFYRHCIKRASVRIQKSVINLTAEAAIFGATKRQELRVFNIFQPTIRLIGKVFEVLDILQPKRLIVESYLGMFK